MDFLILIKNGCDNLTATVSPSMDSIGLHMVLSLATIMLVWFGVQEALASAQGGPGFSVAKFLNFFLLTTFAYCFVKFYDGAIPGIGYSLKGFISDFVIEQERKDNVIQIYTKEGSLPYVDVEIKNVILDDLRQSPYSARIEFEKVFTNPADHSEIKRERWTASVTYVFRENVRNNELAVNPLGLTIVRFRADQAFS